MRLSLFGFGAVENLIIANFVMFILTLISPGWFFQNFAMSPCSFMGEPWTLITSIFMHDGVSHILFNMIALFFLGTYLEGLVGEYEFLKIYFIGGIAGSVLFLLIANPNVMVVGASGAIFAVAATMAILRPNIKMFVFPIPFPIPLYIAVFRVMVILSFQPETAWQGRHRRAFGRDIFRAQTEKFNWRTRWLLKNHNLYPIFLRKSLLSFASFSVSIPFGFAPSTTPSIPRPSAVSATTTSTSFAVAQKMRHTSGVFLTAFRMFIGNASFRNIMKQCPAPIFMAFFAANLLSSWSFPAMRTRQGPEASQNAKPNFIPGTQHTIASYKSSTVFMKCDCPSIMFKSFGFSILIISVSIFSNYIQGINLW